MEAQTTLHERRQLNLDIETASIEGTYTIATIMTMINAGSPGNIAPLYDKFYTAFQVLFILTNDLPALKNSENETARTQKWLDDSFDRNTETTVRVRCKEGYKMFLEYKKLLTSKGIISLPAR